MISPNCQMSPYKRVIGSLQIGWNYHSANGAQTYCQSCLLPTVKSAISFCLAFVICHCVNRVNTVQPESENFCYLAHRKLCQWTTWILFQIVFHIKNLSDCYYNLNKNIFTQLITIRLPNPLGKQPQLESKCMQKVAHLFTHLWIWKI